MTLEIEEKWKKQQSTIRLLIFTFIGAAIQFVIVMPAIWDMVSHPEKIIQNTHQTTMILPPILDSPTMAVLFFGFTIVYCIATSLSFPQKRMISPINIQALTFGLIAILIPYLIIQLNPAIQIDPKDLVSFLVYVLSITMAIGLAQTPIVKFVIGMNGSKEDTEQHTLRIYTSFENVKKILLSKDFRDSFYFQIPVKFKKQRNLVVLKSKLLTQENIILVLAKDRDLKDNQKECCLLSTIAYEARYYQIQKSDRVKTKQTMILNELERQLLVIDSAIIIDKDIGLDNEISDFTSDLALGSTNNKLEYLRELSGFNVAALIGLGLLFGIMSYFRYFTHSLSRDSYITIVFFIGIAVIIDLLPRFTRTNRELDF